MQIKTCELKEAALDYMVALAIGKNVTIGLSTLDDAPVVRDRAGWPWKPSSEGSHGLPIVEKEIYQINRCQNGTKGKVFFEAIIGFEDEETQICMAGPTMLSAAMRAVVCRTFGKTSEVPDQLIV